MDITIKFDNYNGGSEEGVRVYRSDAVISSAALPAPLATLPPGATEYVDTTAVRGSKYYYRFGVFLGTDEVLTKNYMVLAVAPVDTGPGPQILQAGDWELGFFGYCNSATFISYGGLVAALGLEVGNATTDYGWMKMAYKGKVIFVPRSTVRNSISFNQLYQAGAVYGTNDNGPVVPTGAVATNQFRIQDIGGFSFIPRIMKGTADGEALPTSRLEPNDTIPASNEYDDIMGALMKVKRYNSDTTYGRFGNIEDVGVVILSSGYAVHDHCQQMASYADASLVLLRGGRRYYNEMKVATRVRYPVAATQVAVTGTAEYSNYTVIGGWRPILELVM
jgi:hypothetical protein